MGNAVCLGKAGRLDDLCAGRGFPEFIAPNTENVNYRFSYSKEECITFQDGAPLAVSHQGFTLEEPTGERRAPKYYTVKEYLPNPALNRVHVSGRVLVYCPDTSLPSTSVPNALNACAFKVCTRGKPIYGSVKTKTFTHTAHVITSGVFLALVINCTNQGLFLCPRLVLVLENGDEVMLVDDRLGPLEPQSFYLDFALLDDAGRNVQADLIFRGVPTDGQEGGMRTLRTCLQEYTMFNSQLQPASMALCSPGIQHLMSPASVHLQDLVISEEQLGDEPSGPQPCWAAISNKVDQASGRIIYEGVDANLASRAIDAADGSVTHPQLQPWSVQGTPSRSPTPAGDGSRTPNGNGNGQDIRREDFWYHVRYDDDFDRSKAEYSQYDYITRIKGEFWLSRQAVDKKNMYYHCSSTLSQAITMCTVFRFSCPLDHLKLIERAGSQACSEKACGEKQEAITVLREWHIPANGLVLGIEPDPRHRRLLRMFIEHRNEIKDDMVVCECRSIGDLNRTIVHQEIYDSGTCITFRVTLLHKDGGRQSAVLKINSEEFEEANHESSRSQYRLVEEPSQRFPISPCALNQTVCPASRIFVYSGVVYEPPDDSYTDADGGDGGDGVDACETPDERQPLEEASPSRAFSLLQQDTAEDWQSVGGGFSDCEGNEAVRACGSTDVQKAKLLNSEDQFTGQAEWRRPLVESVVLVSKMEEPPFRCSATMT